MRPHPFEGIKPPHQVFVFVASNKNTEYDNRIRHARRQHFHLGKRATLVGTCQSDDELNLTGSRAEEPSQAEPEKGEGEIQWRT